MYSPVFHDSIGMLSDAPRHIDCWGDGDEDNLIWHLMPCCGNPGGDALLSKCSEDILAEKPSGGVVCPVTAQRHAAGGFDRNVKSSASPPFATSDGFSFERSWPCDVECVSWTSGLTDGDFGHSSIPLYNKESDSVFARFEQNFPQLLSSPNNSPCSTVQAVTVPSPEMLSPRETRPRVSATPNFETNRGSVSRHRRPRHPRPQNRPKLNPPAAVSKVIPCTFHLMAC